MVICLLFFFSFFKLLSIKTGLISPNFLTQYHLKVQTEKSYSKICSLPPLPPRQSLAQNRDTPATENTVPRSESRSTNLPCLAPITGYSMQFNQLLEKYDNLSPFIKEKSQKHSKPLLEPLAAKHNPSEEKDPTTQLFVSNRTLSAPTKLAPLPKSNSLKNTNLLEETYRAASAPQAPRLLPALMKSEGKDQLQAKERQRSKKSRKTINNSEDNQKGMPLSFNREELNANLPPEFSELQQLMGLHQELRAEMKTYKEKIDSISSIPREKWYFDFK